MKKAKLPSEKTLKIKLWNLVKEEVRKNYPWDKCYICKKPIGEKKKSHTGHLFKIGTLPLQLKYDLRLLRPCCFRCNRPLNGNEARYMVEVLREVGLGKLMELVHDIENTIDLEGVPVRREFLLSEISKYVDKDVT